jgi:hypothetical protein
MDPLRDRGRLLFSRLGRQLKAAGMVSSHRRTAAGLPILVRLALLYALLVFLPTFYFSLSRELALPAQLLLLAGAFGLGGLFGLAVTLGDRVLLPATAYLRRAGPAFVAPFLLFFAYIIGYTLIFSGLVAHPLGLVIARTAADPALAQEYRLFSMNFALLLALLSWLAAQRRLGGKVLEFSGSWREKARDKETP